MFKFRNNKIKDSDGTQPCFICLEIGKVKKSINPSCKCPINSHKKCLKEYRKQLGNKCPNNCVYNDVESVVENDSENDENFLVSVMCSKYEGSCLRISTAILFNIFRFIIFSLLVGCVFPSIIGFIFGLILDSNLITKNILKIWLDSWILGIIPYIVIICIISVRKIATEREQDRQIHRQIQVLSN